jgi:hypothetical protein
MWTLSLSTCPFTGFISKTTQQILMKFGIVGYTNDILALNLVLINFDLLKFTQMLLIFSKIIYFTKYLCMTLDNDCMHLFDRFLIVNVCIGIDLGGNNF